MEQFSLQYSKFEMSYSPQTRHGHARCRGDGRLRRAAEQAALELLWPSSGTGKGIPARQSRRITGTAARARLDASASLASTTSRNTAPSDVRAVARSDDRGDDVVDLSFPARPRGLAQHAARDRPTALGHVGALVEDHVGGDAKDGVGEISPGYASRKSANSNTAPRWSPQGIAKSCAASSAAKRVAVAALAHGDEAETDGFDAMFFVVRHPLLVFRLPGRAGASVWRSQLAACTLGSRARARARAHRDRYREPARQPVAPSSPFTCAHNARSWQ